MTKIPKQYRYSKLECKLLNALQRQWIEAVILRQQKMRKKEENMRRFREKRAQQIS